MFVFTIDCPDEGLGRVMQALDRYGIKTDSRNGPVIRFPQPVCLEYPNPRHRLITNPVRDANHFFHLFESIWMFAGLDTVAPLDLYNSGMKNYSDDGITFAAPYGYRWRKHFGFDQIRTAVEKLQANPEDRRIVIQMWDPAELKKESGKDFACNQQILLDTRKMGEDLYVLDMTVTNRSNDLIYGAMGSNLFHFSLLHEYLAYHASLGVGAYYQISKNMHLYLENEASQRCWNARHEFEKRDFDTDRSLSALGLTLDMEPLEKFVNHQDSDVTQDYLGRVVQPITNAYRIYKTKALTGRSVPLEDRISDAVEQLQYCESVPLRVACTEWFLRRLDNHRKKQK